MPKEKINFEPVAPTIKFKNYQDYSVYIISPWSEWFRKRTKKPVEYSIADYKKDFRKRPNWAQSFSEQGIDNISVERDRYKYKLIVPKEFQNRNQYLIERERLLNVPGILGKFIVERVFDMSGRLQRVTKVRIKYGELDEIQVENPLGHGKWESKTVSLYDVKEFKAIGIGKLVKLQKPW